MRETKFMAWDKELEKMLTDHHQYGKDEPDVGLKHSSAGAFTRLWEALARFEESNRFTLIQYIGRKDKNSKEVYEEFVLRTNEAGWVGKVVYRYDKYILVDNTGGYSLEPVWDKCEVIGTSFQNPELLK